MSSLRDRLSPVERAAFDRWIAGAVDRRFGRCASCGQTRDDDGSPLYVARQNRGRKFECLACFEHRH